MSIRIDVVTIFPDYLAPLDLSLIGKARREGLVDLHVHRQRLGAAAQVGRHISNGAHLRLSGLHAKGRQLHKGLRQARHIERSLCRQLLDHAKGLIRRISAAQQIAQAHF